MNTYICNAVEECTTEHDWFYDLGSSVIVNIPYSG